MTTFNLKRFHTNQDGSTSESTFTMEANTPLAALSAAETMYFGTSVAVHLVDYEVKGLWYNRTATKK